MSLPPTVLGGCTGYAPDLLRQAIIEVLEPLGGMAAFVRPGERILLKPNLLAGRRADTAINTNPLFVAVVATLVREAGATVVVGDSPGLESTAGAAARSGLAAVLAEFEVETVSFGPETSRLEGGDGHTFKHFDVARAVAEADGVINLPKLKTHGQMALTMGVKNTLGCVVGLQKAQWHLRAGSYDVFSGALLALHDAIAPRLTLLDGIVGMDGNGPFSGRPVHTGLVAASSSARCLDQVVADLIGFSVEQVPTLVTAALPSTDLCVERRSSLPGSFPQYEPAFRWPHVGWIPFPAVREAVRRWCTPKPVFAEPTCVGCYECVRICPAEALSKPTNDNRVPTVSLEKCIRCFCCQEICPPGAITIESGWISRLLNRFC